MLYEMITGWRAFEADSQAALIGAILLSEPRPMQDAQTLVPAALDQLVQRCLAKDPDDRWQTVRDLVSQLSWTATDIRASRPSEPPLAWHAHIAWGLSAR